MNETEFEEKLNSLIGEYAKGNEELAKVIGIVQAWAEDAASNLYDSAQCDLENAATVEDFEAAAKRLRLAASVQSYPDAQDEAEEAIEAAEEAFIRKRPEELKAALRRLAASNAPRPEGETILGRALALFTEPN